MKRGDIYKAIYISKNEFRICSINNLIICWKTKIDRIDTSKMIKYANIYKNIKYHYTFLINQLVRVSIPDGMYTSCKLVENELVYYFCL